MNFINMQVNIVCLTRRIFAIGMIEEGGKTIKMTYNAALKKRIVRHDLIEEVGLDRNQYWGFFELTNEQFDRIAQKGDVTKILKK